MTPYIHYLLRNAGHVTERLNLSGTLLAASVRYEDPSVLIFALIEVILVHYLLGLKMWIWLCDFSDYNHNGADNDYRTNHNAANDYDHR